MSGQDYLKAIKTELEQGRRQSRMGETLLAAFGYVRRRRTVTDEITEAIDSLRLKTDPPIDQVMPLRTPRINFYLQETDDTSNDKAQAGSKAPGKTQDDMEEDPVIVVSFRIGELSAANKPVGVIGLDSPISEANTRMTLSKYSQLVVANGDTPRHQDIKGIVSYHSIALTMLFEGSAETVRDCLDESAPILHHDRDLQDALKELDSHNVVLVVGADNRLQGIVTAADLAEEFAGLVDPFKRIGEIEQRLRSLLRRRLGIEFVRCFLEERMSSSFAPTDDLDGLTMGELQHVLAHPDNWQKLNVTAVDRQIFIKSLDIVRLLRNRLMHFKDPLNESELRNLANFCDLVRQMTP